LKARPLCAGASVESNMRSLSNDVCIEWTTIAVSPPPAKASACLRDRVADIVVEAQCH
jgi:hypothetical protein